MIDRQYREALALYKMRKKLTFEELGQRLKTTSSVASDIIHGRREYVSLGTAQAIFEIMEENSEEEPEENSEEA